MIHKFVFLIIILLSQNSYSSIINSHGKIAIVDVQTILDNSSAMNSIKISVENMSKELENEFKTTEEVLKKEESEIIATKSFCTEEEFTSKIVEFNKKVTNFQKIFQEKKQKLEQSHSEAVSKVNSVALEIIKNISITENYDVVLPNTQVLFANQKLDITNLIISKLNEQITTVNIDYK